MAEPQRPDLLAESADLISDVEPDAVPDQSSNQNSLQEARVVSPQQTHPVISETLVVAASPQIHHQTRPGISLGFPFQDMVTGSLQEGERASSVHQRTNSHLLSDRLKEVDPKAAQPQISSIQPLASNFLFLSIEENLDKEIESYRKKFPGYLRSDYYDAMIVYHEEDLDDASQFLYLVNNCVKLSNGKMPNVALYTDVRSDITNEIGQLDESLKLCTYTILYVTKNFCSDDWMEFISYTSLMVSINNPEKKWSVIPIFTASKQQKAYGIPPSIFSLKGIQYLSGQKFDPNPLQKLLEEKLHVREMKDSELKHERKKWILNKKMEERQEADRRKQEIQQAVKEANERYKNEKKEKENKDKQCMHLQDQEEV